MSFAVSLGGNPDRLEQCRYIEPDKGKAIKSLLVQGDWRDELIKSLMHEVSSVNFREIAPGLGCEARGDALVVRCLGREYMIGRDGAVTPETRNKWIKILLLNYVRNKGKGEFSGKWVSFSDLKGGFVKVASFEREYEEPLREMMDRDPIGTALALERLGAEKSKEFSADNVWSLDLLPKVRALILYRRSDEEFPSSLTTLFDSVTTGFIDVETLIFLCGGLIHTLSRTGLA